MRYASALFIGCARMLRRRMISTKPDFLRGDEMDLGLKGRKVIIGGGTHGISRAITEVLAAEGADIALFSRKQEGLAEHRDALARHGGRIVARTHTLDDRD